MFHICKSIKKIYRKKKKQHTVPPTIQLFIAFYRAANVTGSGLEYSVLQPSSSVVFNLKQGFSYGVAYGAGSPREEVHFVSLQNFHSSNFWLFRRLLIWRSCCKPARWEETHTCVAWWLLGTAPTVPTVKWALTCFRRPTALHWWWTTWRLSWAIRSRPTHRLFQILNLVSPIGKFWTIFIVVFRLLSFFAVVSMEKWIPG